ncbi:hypothetical protein BaRGS_00036482 [Batillaria attramentaria]|uniref:EB domain-containing protein n=1 Tax=Batillaria attramentaria TaxID=370345 RepID=A0ABD0JBU2_9CAEN
MIAIVLLFCWVIPDGWAQRRLVSTKTCTDDYDCRESGEDLCIMWDSYQEVCKCAFNRYVNGPRCLDRTPLQTLSNSNCTRDEDCREPKYSVCKDGVCRCTEHGYPINNGMVCWPEHLLGNLSTIGCGQQPQSRKNNCSSEAGFNTTHCGRRYDKFCACKPEHAVANGKCLVSLRGRSSDSVRLLPSWSSIVFVTLFGAAVARP